MKNRFVKNFNDIVYFMTRGIKTRENILIKVLIYFMHERVKAISHIFNLYLSENTYRG